MASAQAHVTCVGDSITYGDGTTNPPSTGYPALLQALLGGGYSVENDGHSGATMLKAGDIPYWNQAEYASSTTWAQSGGDVVIQLGTNDSKPANWKYGASFVGDCEAMIDHYRAQSPSARVWINLIPPTGASPCCKIDGTVIENEIIPALKTCASDKGATTIDVHAALAPHTDWYVDGVHPNDQGAQLLAQTVYDAISKLPTIGLSASAPATPAPASITLTATPTAAYGKVEKVGFYDGATLLGEVTTAPWQTTLPAVAAGTHMYTAQITESAGRTATSAAVQVVVDEPPPPPDAGTSADASTVTDGGTGVTGSTSSSGTGSMSSSSSSSGSPASSASSASGGTADADADAPADAADGESGCATSRGDAGAGGAAVLALAIVAITGRRRSRTAGARRSRTERSRS